MHWNALHTPHASPGGAKNPFTVTPTAVTPLPELFLTGEAARPFTSPTDAAAATRRVPNGLPDNEPDPDTGEMSDLVLDFDPVEGVGEGDDDPDVETRAAREDTAEADIDSGTFRELLLLPDSPRRCCWPLMANAL